MWVLLKKKKKEEEECVDGQAKLGVWYTKIPIVHCMQEL